MLFYIMMFTIPLITYFVCVAWAMRGEFVTAIYPTICMALLTLFVFGLIVPASLAGFAHDTEETKTVKSKVLKFTTESDTGTDIGYTFSTTDGWSYTVYQGSLMGVTEGKSQVTVTESKGSPSWAAPWTIGDGYKDYSLRLNLDDVTE